MIKKFRVARGSRAEESRREIADEYPICRSDVEAEYRLGEKKTVAFGRGVGLKR